MFAHFHEKNCWKTAKRQIVGRIMDESLQLHVIVAIDPIFLGIQFESVLVPCATTIIVYGWSKLACSNLISGKNFSSCSISAAKKVPYSEWVVSTKKFCLKKMKALRAMVSAMAFVKRTVNKFFRENKNNQSIMVEW